MKLATNDMKQPNFNTHNVTQPKIKQYFCPTQPISKAKQSQDDKFSLVRRSSDQTHPTPPVPIPAANLDKSKGEFFKHGKWRGKSSFNTNFKS